MKCYLCQTPTNETRTVKLADGQRHVLDVACRVIYEHLYLVMTPGGTFAADIEATDDEDARRVAELRGHIVLDVMDPDDLDNRDVEAIIVVQ